MFVRLTTERAKGWSVRALPVWLATTVACWMASPPLASADLFTVREDDGNEPTVEARLVGEGQGMLALERNDGRIEIIPIDRILKRLSAPDPAPMSPNIVLERLTKRFGKETFRGKVEQNYVIGMVLAEPLPEQFDKTANSLLTKSAKFMKSVERYFVKFADDVKIDLEKPRYPLVVLIFETDDDFIKFTERETGGTGLSAGNMLGYYNALTNHLVIRMSECHTFATPLHEAIHQQVYNRGVLQRLSPAPAWFNEGIATGFEGNGEQINSGPLKVNSVYARRALNAKNVDWDDVVADDKAFRGDVLAGEAYANAWGIHWFLVTKYRKQYTQYLQLLSQKKTLQKDDAQTRLNDFEGIFGKSVGKLQSEFPKALASATAKQDPPSSSPKPAGYLHVQSNLAEIELNVAKTATGETEATGQMRNISQLRPMSFYITVETDAGTYAEWYLPHVAPRQSPIQLDRAQITKVMQNGPGGPSRSFGVRVRAAVPESETGRQWQDGQLPIPRFSGQ